MARYASKVLYGDLLYIFKMVAGGFVGRHSALDIN